MDHSHAQRESRISPQWLVSTPLMDDIQAGSLRHILNLAARLPDDWSGMQGRTTLQEDFGALRFQLAYMAYALGLAHVHRLPAAPAVFRQPFDSLIGKILSPDVWTYWHYVGTGNGPFNKSLGELPAQWDPVVRDNIMYSAYVQSMALLYHYLFRDDKYAAEGALTFSVNPLFWGEGGKHFAYDERSLNQHLYWSMVERGYLGIACEPNCVFQICNQPSILGFRFHDLVYGGSIAEEVTTGYLQAWSEFGVLNDAGHFNMMVQERERQVITPTNLPWTDFWMAALMHAWNPDFVKEHYPRFVAQWVIDGPDGSAWVKPAPTLAPGAADRSTAYDFGWAAVCASEVGDEALLTRLHAYADARLDPTWQHGGLYYPRCDQRLDEDGVLRAMDPHTGNALLPYSRLNVPGGLRALYEGPWQDEHFAQPGLTAVTPSLDVRRAWFDPHINALALTLTPVRDTRAKPEARLELDNVWNRGNWRLERDQELLAYGKADQVLWTSPNVRVERAHEQMIVELDVVDTTTMVLSWN